MTTPLQGALAEAQTGSRGWLLSPGLSVALAVAVILAVNLALFLATNAWLSVAQADDPIYQTLSARPISEILAADANTSRLYQIWYKVLGLFGSEAVFLTAANNLILSLALALLSFFYARRGTQSIWSALAAALLVTLSCENMGIWPKVSQFAMVVVLMGLLASRCFKRLPAQLNAFAVVLLVGAMARPELMIGAAMALAFSVVAAWRGDRAALTRHLGATFAVVGVAAVLHLAVQLPMVGETGRSGRALSQHFALNWMMWNALPGDPWFEHEGIWSSVFGNAQGFAAAFRANPGALFHHVSDNLSRALLLPPAMTFVPATTPLPVWPVVLYQPSIAVGYVLGYSFLLAALGALVKRDAWNAVVREYAGELPKWLCILVPAGISCVMIYPRYHYMVPFSVLIGIFGWTAIDRRWGSGRRYPLWVLGFLAVQGVSVLA